MASPDTGGARVGTCWVVGAADQVEEVGLPEVRIVVEVGEGAWVEEFRGIEVPVRVGAGDVGTDAVAGAGDVAAEETAGAGGVGAVVDGGASSGTGEVVTGEATRTVGTVEETGAW